MFDETCKWRRVKDLVWSTECEHQIGTPRSWEPEGSCICCKKPVEVMNDAGSEGQKTDQTNT
jgi:hypothetical protein